MANKSSSTLEEGGCEEKPNLIPQKFSDLIRDFFPVVVGVGMIALGIFLLKTFYIASDIPTLSFYGNSYRAPSICHEPFTRREWRALRDEEKLEFIKAIKCLTQKPSKLGLPTTRYDDFVYIHVKLYPGTHNVAPSLPWHRYYIKVFENVLRKECNFKGHLPYWDWTLDATTPEDSPIWSVINGFGGNGATKSHCLQNGHFNEFKPQYPHKHCLQRDFTPGMIGFNYTIEKIRNLWQNTSSYHEFRTNLESGAHKSVHNGIGGEMPTHGSSNDPIFFVHHAQIDRIWWHWQQLQPKERNEDYFGPNNISEPYALSQATLQDTLTLMGLDKDRMVADLMDSKSSLLCYKY